MQLCLRTRSFDVPPQEILTKDSVTVNVDAVVYYNIHDTLASVINVEDADKSTKQISATTLRSILVKEATDAWGVQVHTCIRRIITGIQAQSTSKMENVSKIARACC